MTTNNKGFTIIEVVITIAIGAAVMALVLNAVAGARRSQRNNARQADVNKIAAGVNQYIATRNALPPDWNAIKDIVDEGSLGHYERSFINAAGSWSTTIPDPNNNGVFRALDNVGASTIDHTCGEDTGDTGDCATIPQDSSNNNLPHKSPPTCDAGDGDIDTCTYIEATGSVDSAPQSTGKMADGTSDDYDHIVVFRQASCAANNAIAVGGIREIAIAYKLEGQSDIVCLEV